MSNKAEGTKVFAITRYLIATQKTPAKYSLLTTLNIATAVMVPYLTTDQILVLSRRLKLSTEAV